jgi:hypothetical protein
MSRWIEQYDAHPFQEIWSQILDLSDTVDVDDQSVATDVQELARFTKVVCYLDELIKGCDPELVPLSTWGNFHSQGTACLTQVNHYQNNRNIQHMHTANEHVDNLLTYIRPYMGTPARVSSTVQSAFRKYTKTINKSLVIFQESAKELIEEIEGYKTDSENNSEKISEAKNYIDSLKMQYFDDTEDSESLKTRIEQLKENIETWHEVFEEYHQRLVGDDIQEDSISSQIESAKNTAIEDQESVSRLLESTEKQLTELSKFYDDVYGKENSEGELEGGLKSEIKDRRKDLDAFSKQQEKQYTTLLEEIESLLPGSTSAGLATAYYDLKESFNKPIENYSKLFYGAVFVLVIATMFSIVDSIGLWSIKFVDTSDLSKLLSNTLYKLPLLLPVIWMAIFASRRRSEAHRLQQEYAHKEALAKSYQSFKTQIEGLGDQPDNELMKHLLTTAIGAISFNASSTLDKKHGDNTPVQDI